MKVDNDDTAATSPGVESPSLYVFPVGHLPLLGCYHYLNVKKLANHIRSPNPDQTCLFFIM